MPDNFEPKNPANPYEDYTVERLYDYLSHCILTKKPGESFEYSNVGMGLLGHILSIRSGQSYEELIHTLITSQLDIANTSISLTDEMSRNFATGHHLGHTVGYWDIPGLAGAGALRSNVKDMSRFLAANMALSQSPLTKIMQQCHEQQCTVSTDCAFGFGWVLSNSNHAELIWHDGGTGGFRTFLGFNPKLQRGVVILSNSTEDWPDEFGVLLLNPEYKRPLIDKTLASDANYMSQFVGSYEVTLPGDSSKQDLQISVFGKLLATQLSGGEVGMLYPESHGIFGVKGFPDGKVYFSFDAVGNISKVEARLVSTETVLWEAIPRPLE
jgi:serine-type D-Ala-D-Ala carboxypeptidase/endopeptidase